MLVTEYMKLYKSKCKCIYDSELSYKNEDQFGLRDEVAVMKLQAYLEDLQKEWPGVG